MKVAIVQGGPTLDVDKSIAQMEEKCTAAAASGVDLIIFSELYLCGYEIGPEIVKFAEPFNGPSFKRISEIAKRNKINIIYGYAELGNPEEHNNNNNNNIIYNSAALVDANGDLAVNYRKTHLYDPTGSEYEKVFFTPGNSFAPLVTIAGVKVGILICFDIEFPEPARVLALRGAQFIAVPTANTTLFHCQTTVASRAFENQVFIAYVNRVGPLYVKKEQQQQQQENGAIEAAATTAPLLCGSSAIVAPTGEDLVRCSREGQMEMLVAKIEPNDPKYVRSRERNPYFADFRPELYADLWRNL